MMLLQTMTKLTFVQNSNAANWEKEFLLRVKNELSQPSPGTNFQIVDHMDQADLVLYLDAVTKKPTKRDLTEYQALLERVQARGGLLFALNFQDRPLGILPGIYTSLEPQNFDPTLHLSWPHLEPPNSNVETPPNKCSRQIPFLFTFAGSCSHRLRRKLFSLYAAGSGDRWKVVEIDRWYDHTESEKTQYVQDIVDSRFVLCPRGIASYSHRIFESILLERVPVIIADNWLPFSFKDQEYYVKVPEKDIGQIESILERELENYDSYLANLRAIKSKWFSKHSRYRIAIEHFLQFHQQNLTDHDPAKLTQRLQSTEFQRNNKLLYHQRILTKATKFLDQLA